MKQTLLLFDDDYGDIYIIVSGDSFLFNFLFLVNYFYILNTLEGCFYAILTLKFILNASIIVFVTVSFKFASF